MPGWLWVGTTHQKTSTGNGPAQARAAIRSDKHQRDTAMPEEAAGTPKWSHGRSLTLAYTYRSQLAQHVACDGQENTTGPSQQQATRPLTLAYTYSSSSSMVCSCRMAPCTARACRTASTTLPVPASPCAAKGKRIGG